MHLILSVQLLQRKKIFESINFRYINKKEACIANKKNRLFLRKQNMRYSNFQIKS